MSWNEINIKVGINNWFNGEPRAEHQQTCTVIPCNMYNDMRDGKKDDKEMAMAQNINELSVSSH